MALSKYDTHEAVSIGSVFEDDSNKSKPLTIAPEAMSHVINRLTNMYTKPVDATVRETISNAIDATNAAVSAGKEREAIEISLPSDLYPYFAVQDHGAGMSLETVDKIYMSYGLSTKRTDLTQVGSHGLGAKAPLSYSNQYDVVTTHEGVTTHFSVFASDAGPNWTLISSETTNKSSGTFVKIPVNKDDFEDFQKSAQTYRDHSFDAPIIVNGVKHFGNSEYVLGGEITIEAESGTTGRVWVMRDTVSEIIRRVEMVPKSFDDHPYVAYILNGYLYNKTSNGSNDHNILVELKPGVVNFSSSRDEITVDDRLVKLNNLVNGQLNSGATVFYGALVEHINLLTRNEAVAELSAARVTIPIVDGQRVTFKSCDNVWKVSELFSTDGNLLADAAKVSKDVILGTALRINAYNSIMQTVSGFLREKNGLFPILVRRNFSTVTDFSNNAFDAIDGRLVEDDVNSRISVADIASMVTMGDSHVMFVSIDNSADVKRLIRMRASLCNAIQQSLVIVFVDGSKSLSEFDKDFVKKYSNGGTFEFATFDEVAARVKISRGKTSNAPTKLSCSGYVFTESGFDSRKDLLISSGEFKSNTNMDVAELVSDKKYLFVPINSYGQTLRSDVLTALNGYLEVHGDDALKGRAVVILARPSLPVVRAIGDYSRFIFPMNYRAASQEVIVNAVNHTYGKSLKNDTLASMGDKALIGYYVSALFGYKVRPFKDMAESLDNLGVFQSHIDRAHKFGRNFEIDRNYRLRPEVNALKIDDMKRHLNSDNYKELNNYVRVVNAAFASRSDSPLALAIKVVQCNGISPEMVKATVAFIGEKFDEEEDD